jgi:murein L,D-transpeptidase YafK
MWICSELLLVASLLQASAATGTVAQHGKVDLIVIAKSAHTMTLLRQGNARKTYRVALSTVPVGAKERVGDHQVPEGKYTIDKKKPASRFHLA